MCVDVDAPRCPTACLASILAGDDGGLLQALWVIESAPGAGNIFIDISISFVVAAYLVGFTDRKVGCNLLR